MNAKTKELPKNIKTWVDALESGKYSQCQETLHNGEGYCCLGVYAKVVLGLPDKELVGELDTYGEPVRGEGSTNVYKSIKLELGESEAYDAGIQMNDGGDTFVDIAKMIREAYT